MRSGIRRECEVKQSQRCHDSEGASHASSVDSSLTVATLLVDTSEAGLKPRAGFPETQP